MPFLILLITLGVLQYGWIIWPEIGFYTGLASFIALVGIVAVGLAIRKK